MKKKLSISLIFMCFVVMANAQEAVNSSFKKGPAGIVEVGTMFNQGFSGGYASVSSGYNVLPGLFTGVGVGFKTQKFSVQDVNSLLVPVFAQVRYSLLNKTFSPFIDLKAGLLADYTKSLKTMKTPYVIFMILCKNNIAFFHASFSSCSPATTIRSGFV